MKWNVLENGLSLFERAKTARLYRIARCRLNCFLWQIRNHQSTFPVCINTISIRYSASCGLFVSFGQLSQSTAIISISNNNQMISSNGKTVREALKFYMRQQNFKRVNKQPVTRGHVTRKLASESQGTLVIQARKHLAKSDMQ